VARGSVLRTPAERFSHLPDFRYEPQFTEIEGLRIAYVEAGHGQPMLMLHGEPTWSYLYRRMIPTLAEAGRVIVPDLIGFGRSDKPVNDNAYSYRSHAHWLRHFIKQLDLWQITLVCQDWGGSAQRSAGQAVQRVATHWPTRTQNPHFSARTPATGESAGGKILVTQPSTHIQPEVT
jgi:pimeloyl-ACP methyl ester carboxylesterase